MIESTGPITRPTPVDPLDLEVWPIACVLAWIIAVDAGHSPEGRDELVRQAHQQEARALPRDTLAAGRKLIDFAAANPERLKLWHPGGVIEDFRLGPEALIFPTLGESGILTFGLRPHTVIRNTDDIGVRILGLWCFSRDVQSAWPAQKDAPTRWIAAAETRCREWLIQEMRASREQTTTAKIEWYRRACKKFSGLGNFNNVAPSKAFERAWTAAVNHTGAKWNLSGRKKSER